MTDNASEVVQVAVAVPLRRLFDYRCDRILPLGTRVKVPFGKLASAFGVVVSRHPPSTTRKLKAITAVLDSDSVFGDTLLALLLWAARYYHHPPGEVLRAALPTALRKGEALTDPSVTRCIRAVLPGDAPSTLPDALRRASKQADIYRHLVAARGVDDGWVEAAVLTSQFPHSAATVRALLKKECVESTQRRSSRAFFTAMEAAADAAPGGEHGASNHPTEGAESADAPRGQADSAHHHEHHHERAASSNPPAAHQPIHLNPEQQDAVQAVADCAGRFGSFLLHGVTGSGKTEVYLEAAQRLAASGKQTLILVPEIALTPQLVARFYARLGGGVCALHSGLAKAERYRAWWLAREGRAAVVLGTRSALFTPLKSPGLIVVDEEHDASYKQRDNLQHHAFQYHARDLAIKRASLEGIPVLLGSATPSMESRHNARPGGRHRLLTISARAGAAALPRVAFIDLAQHRPVHGLAMPLQHAIEKRLRRREQSIIFLNRRGFSPTAHCRACGWKAACHRCDARLTYHRQGERFQCHHCGHSAAAAMTCQACEAPLLLLGAGTQRVEQRLRETFPTARISRLDRDQISTQNQLERELEAIRQRQTDIVIGTQLIAKGHDFSGVTLVGVIDSDHGLHSVDFRAEEYLFQQLTQVAGRAGRGATAGEVLIQSAHPQHRLLQYMRRHDVDGFAAHCLAERRAARYPPFSHFALWRAESTAPAAALNFLRHSADIGQRLLSQTARTDGAPRPQIMDAVASPMEKLADRYRAQLMVRSQRRGPLHQLLAAWINAIETDPSPRRTRWSIDVDPMEMF